MGPNRAGLLHQVTEVVSRGFEWSVRLTSVLRENSVWEADIWSAIIAGWQNSTLSEEQWQQVLGTLLEAEEIVASVVYDASRLLETGVNKTSHAIPIPQLRLAVELADKLWNACLAAGETARETAEDWLQLAINHPAGSLLTFRLQVLSRLRVAAGKDWIAIPQQDKEFLSAVVSGDSYPAAIGRVLIASQTYFLFATDQEWTIHNVLPLLSFGTSYLTAVQAWHGFLVWGSWTEDLLPYLMPYFEEAFSHAHTDFGEDQRESFCGFLAGIACRSSVNPIHDGWLNRFLLAVTSAERTMWASSVYRALQGMKEEAVESAWTNWIEVYWQNRIDGVPAHLEASEAAQMLHWCIMFRASFSHAAEKMYRSPVPVVEHLFLHHSLNESDLPGRQPLAVARFVAYLLRKNLIPGYDLDPVIDIVTKIRPFAEARSELLEICQQLAAVGYSGAAALRDSIIENGQR